MREYGLKLDKLIIFEHVQSVVAKIVLWRLQIFASFFKNFGSGCCCSCLGHLLFLIRCFETVSISSTWNPCCSKHSKSAPKSPALSFSLAASFPCESHVEVAWVHLDPTDAAPSLSLRGVGTCLVSFLI